MTETEWLASEDPAKMLEYIKGKVSDRKLRLFAAAQSVVWTATGDVARKKLQSHLLRDIVGNPLQSVSLPKVPDLCSACKGKRYWIEGGVCGECARCNGDGSYWVCSWLTPAVLALAKGIYEERCFEMLGPLADELEMAGCQSEEILRHCRGQEQCPQCKGSRYVIDAHAVMDIFSADRSLADSQIIADAVRSGILANKPCHCGTGWVPLRGPHVRGCWLLDILLGLK